MRKIQLRKKKECEIEVFRNGSVDGFFFYSIFESKKGSSYKNTQQQKKDSPAEYIVLE